MLELKPNCELCDVDLAADSPAARICSYECTFCSNCVDQVLFNVCPNCGGGFSGRPIRPAKDYRKGVSRIYQTPSTKRIRTKLNLDEINEFSETLSKTNPIDR